MQVLQDALQNLISGTSEVNVDMVTESVYFRSKAGFQAGHFETVGTVGSCRNAHHVRSLTT